MRDNDARKLYESNDGNTRTEKRTFLMVFNTLELLLLTLHSQIEIFISIFVDINYNGIEKEYCSLIEIFKPFTF